MEMPLAMARSCKNSDLLNQWVHGKILFNTDVMASPPVRNHLSKFMGIQVPLFFQRFALSYTKDGTCIEYFLHSKERKNEISTALVVSHDIFSNFINVSKFYPEIYKEPISKYMSASCFFMMMHHAATLFDIHCDCGICLETKNMVFESFYERLKDFDFVIHQQRVSDNCSVWGRYHDFPMETSMITSAM